MIRLSQIKIPVGENGIKLEDKICALLRIKKSRLIGWKIARRSIEARKHETLSYVYTVHVQIKDEDGFFRTNRNKKAEKFVETPYKFPVSGGKIPDKRPVVVGSGPAGLFCAFFLASCGLRPIVLERGEKCEERSASVKKFWEGGALNPESNVQFGEGGAGTFSDGKLNTGVNDKYGRNRAVLELFVKHGAPEEILYDAKPHVGTDILCRVIPGIREEIISLGGTFFFNTRVDEICTKNGSVCSVRAADKIFDTDICVAAVGHSARDTMFMLYEKEVQMEPKAFAVGVRVQHPQEFINKAQWGENAPESLGAAPYKLASRLSDGRNIYTFCMCPGGYIVNSSSENGRLAVNGMSYSGRASGYANSAVIVSVGPEDYLEYAGSGVPKALSAIAFQRELERRAYRAGGGKIPVQSFGDFCAGSISSGFALEPCVKGEYKSADVRAIFPEFISNDIEEGMREFGKKIEGFDAFETLLAGVESRTSSPVRILRDGSFQSNIKGLYPCGEGAGYAGGIMSAAIDGIRTAEAVAKAVYEKSCP